MPAPWTMVARLLAPALRAARAAAPAARRARTRLNSSARPSPTTTTRRAGMRPPVWITVVSYRRPVISPSAMAWLSRPFRAASTAPVAPPGIRTPSNRLTTTASAAASEMDPCWTDTSGSVLTSAPPLHACRRAGSSPSVGFPAPGDPTCQGSRFQGAYAPQSFLSCALRKGGSPLPELPEVTVYVERIRALLAGSRLERLRLFNPFLLRTVDPPPDALAGRVLEDAGRIGKRIVLSFQGDVHAVIHLMITGRLRWRQAGSTPPKRRGLAAFDFESGTVLLTEEGTRRRAALHLVAGKDALRRFDRGGVDILAAGPEVVDALAAALRRENRTLKRALTDPTVV